MKTVELKPGWLIRPCPGYVVGMSFSNLRYDPFTGGIALGMQVIGGLISYQGMKQQGKAAKKIGELRAQAKEREALGVRRETEDKARILERQTLQLIGQQKGGYAAGNVRLNVGAPLVVAAQTNADIQRDKGFMLETGREESAQLRQEGAYERAYGRYLKKQSKWAALAGLFGTGYQVGMGAYDMGLFSKKETE